MSGKKSRDKGARGERLAAELLREIGFKNARRGCQRAGGPDSPDVKGIPGIHVEVKIGSSVPQFIYKTMDQATSDSGDSIPMEMLKRDGMEWLIVLRASDVVEFARRILNGISPAHEVPFKQVDAIGQVHSRPAGGRGTMPITLLEAAMEAQKRRHERWRDELDATTETE